MLHHLLVMTPEPKQESQWLDMVLVHMSADDIYAHLDKLPTMTALCKKHTKHPLVQYLLSLPLNPETVKELQSVNSIEYQKTQQRWSLNHKR